MSDDRSPVVPEVVHTRAFADADEPAVKALWAEVFPGDPPWNEPGAVIAAKKRVQRELFLVAEVDGDVVGTAMAGYDGHRGWVYTVAVSPRTRRRGIGGTLMRAVERGLRGAGCVKLNLQIRASNHEVAAFYEALGYRPEDRLSLGKLLDERFLDPSR